MDEILDLRGACEYLKISPRKIEDLKARNKIPYHKIGGRIVFVKMELLDWVISGKSAEI